MSDEYVKEMPLTIQPGMTTVLDIEAKPDGSAPEPTIVNVQLEGAGIGVISMAYLTGMGQTYPVPIDQEGKGRVENIPPGQYDLTLRPTGTTDGGFVELYFEETYDQPEIYLVGETKNYPVKIQPLAIGSVGWAENIPPGRYEISTTKPGETTQPPTTPEVQTPPERTETPPDKPAVLDVVVLFGFDSADLPEAAYAVLDQVVALLKLPAQSDVTRVECRGFTDSQGSATYNQNLSLRRAVAVKKALDAKLKAAPEFKERVIERTTALGEGELESTDPRSRRVEFHLRRSSAT